MTFRRTAVFTIAARNYLPYARVLMRSLQEVSPEWDRFVLLADVVGGAFDPSVEPFHVIEARTLPVPERQKFFFRYTILELSTAVKPWFFRRLFDDGYDHVVYLDPDIYMYSPMREVEEALEGGALAVLVPHLTGRVRDSARPGEHEILQSGAYNLGFCAIGRHPDLDNLLDFWCEKSVREFVADVQRGLFTDQRWMDLAPGMFRDVTILRHEGYDVAYWNLPHRRLTHSPRGTDVNGAPLIFFHFSGIDPLHPEGFSKHQNRYNLATVGPAAKLATDYCAAVRAQGLKACRDRPYTYGFLGDGSPIPDVLRRLYRTTPEVEAWAGSDPFRLTCTEWNEPIDTLWPPLTRVMLAVYQARSDLRLTWPDPVSKDREAFTRWFAETSELQQVVPECYVRPVRSTLEHPRKAVEKEQCRHASQPALRPDLIGGAMRKARIAFSEGRLPLSPRRWLGLYRLHVAEHAQERLARTSPALPPFNWPKRSTNTVHPTPDLRPPELNIVGYLSDATGIAAGAQASAAACREVGIQCELIDARALQSMRGRYSVNLLHVNADQTPVVARGLGEDFFRDRYTIGVWAWELEEFPDVFMEAFERVQEVWTPSWFIHQAVAEKSPVPVVHMPFAVGVAPTIGLSRRDFGVPEGRFLFLMMYDALSVQERKNPLGALEAFRRAFEDRSNVGLVIRVNHARSKPDDLAILRRQVAGTDGAFLLEGPMSRQDAQALQALCDAFLSLHRSEGLGLNIAEAMLLSRPVVVTGWSGNLDFTTDRNACLVDYQLAKLARDYGPYRRGNQWAEPDIDRAAELMVRLVEDFTFRQAIAARGRETIATEFSPRAVGLRYHRRLTAIRRLRRGMG